MPDVKVVMHEDPPYFVYAVKNYSFSFLADRTIGRAFGTACRLSVCLSVVCDVLYPGKTAGPI